MERVTSKHSLPNRVYCPVCGEILIQVPHSKQDAVLAQAHGALASSKVVCGCGVEGIINLRRTKPEGYHLYSMTFWIMPKSVQQAGTLSRTELRDWLRRFDLREVKT